MAMYNKFITFLVLTFMVSISFAQQYTPMTAAGYQYKRAKVDSTLHIPSFCGVPNLRNSTAIQGALAMDTCANKLYQWTHAAGWSTISTNAVDSLKRSNDSIFARKNGVWVFQYKDSVGGGGSTPSLQDVTDVGNTTTNLISFTKDNSYINIEPSVENSDYYIGQTIRGNNPIGDYSNDILLYSGLVDGGSLITANTTNKNTSNTVGVYMQSDDTKGWIGFYDNNTSGIKISANEITNNYGFQPSSTPYARLNFDVTKNNQIVSLPNQSGVLALSVNGQFADSTGSITIPTIDTSNKFVNNIYRTSGVDSIYYKIGSTTYAIKDSAGGGGQNGRFGNDTATIVMAKVHNDAGVILTNGKVVSFSTSGTNSNAPSVRLANNKADSTSANTIGFVSGTIAVNDTGWVILSGHIEKLNTSAFSNGDIIYLDSTSGNWTKSKPKAPYHMVYLGVVVKANAGNGSIFVKCQNGYELDEIHDVQITSATNNNILVYSDTQKLWKNRSIYSVVDTTNKIATKTDLALKLNISDTATMLSKYLRKTDTASLSSRIDLRVKYTDTSTMLTRYLRKIDTASLSSRINLKLNIADTSSMLTPYLRKIDTTNRFVNNISRTVGKDSIIFNIGSTRYAIKDSVGSGTAYTFSTGLTNSSGTVTSNLSTGVSGGQSVVGGTAASNSLTLSSTTNATKGKILFGTSAYDEVNNRLGIGTASPSYTLDVNLGNIGNVRLIGGSSNNNGFIQAPYSNYIFSSNSFWDGSNFKYEKTGFACNVQCESSTGTINLNNYVSGTAGTNLPAVVPSLAAYSSRNIGINTTADAGYKLDVNGTARVQGALNFNPTNTATGTTGNQTINKASGTVNIAAAGTTVTVTNSLVTASSIVYAVIRTNDATATIKNVVPAEGSFVINLNAATTAETSIGFFVIN